MKAIVWDMLRRYHLITLLVADDHIISVEDWQARHEVGYVTRTLAEKYGKQCLITNMQKATTHGGGWMEHSQDLDIEGELIGITNEYKYCI